MIEKWDSMTSERKREVRFNRWLSPENVDFISPEAEQLYKERVTRLIKAITLEEPDKVPVSINPGYGPARYAGYTIKEVMYDISKIVDAWTRYTHDFELDVLPSPRVVRCGKVLDILDSKMYKWAGHGLPDNLSHQYVESDYMEAGEWDHYLKDQSDYYIRMYLPRVYGVTAPLAKLPALNSLGEFSQGMDAFLDPDVQYAFKALGKAGKVSSEWQKEMGKVDLQFKSAGLPFFETLVRGAVPFDNIGAFLRGTKGTITDMYRCPDLLHEYMEKTVPEAITKSKFMADITGTPVVCMPLHRGADNFMSEEHFCSFYWPYLKRVMLGQIEEGLVPCCFAEGSYNRRLEIIKDFPKGKAIWHFDQTDMKKAKEVLGDVACLMGNVPTSLMVTGSPEMVMDYCAQLIENVGPNGGFVLAPGATADEAKIENIQAMIKAAKEYGMYNSRKK